MPLKAPPAAPAAPSPRQPVKKFRLGRISAAVWRNEVDNGAIYSVTFTRSYLDAQKAFHDTDSFNRDDLPLVAKLADQAHSFIFQAQADKAATS